MDKANEKRLREMPAEWARRATAVTAPADGADLLIEWVRRYNYGEPEIRVLLDELLTRAVAIGRAAGEVAGAEHERATNPAIKSVGEAVAIARRKDREAIRAVVDEVFQREAARCNPFYAFAEALKTIV
jgi:hypothetical protein